MAPAANQVGRGLAKAVGIDIDYRERNEPKEYVQAAASSVRHVDPYYEEEPTTAETIREFIPDRADVVHYIGSLFPFHRWILNYNLTWAFGDFVAGVTVGFVVIPQGMAYAQLAGLEPQYGLYTSFVGFILYFAFATSKDITIGTVAVASTVVGKVIARVQGEYGDLYAPEDIARALSLITGAVLLFIGLVRLGWLCEFIPLVGISSFMTGAAVNIAAGQVPKLLGVKGVNTRAATYQVIIETLRNLPTAGLDAALGMTSLVFLYGIRFFCNYMARRQPKKQKLWFFLATLRMAFVILLYILISYLMNRGVTNYKKARVSILGPVPSGFQVHGAPTINADIISAFASDIPATIFVLIIEHISISKNFGRINNYTIDPSQELVAVGFTNVIGPFLGAYPATGSFSRTAIKSKAGVRTPLAGLWTAGLVLLAIYVLSPMFFYIPNAALAGIIIHAVGDLITPLDVVYRFWQVSPLEVLIFLATVLIMVFTDLESGIYFVVCAAAAVLLVRIAKSRGALLGAVRVRRVSRDSDDDGGGSGGGNGASSRDAYVPLDRSDGSNPDVDVRSPYPGVFVFRFTEGFNYLNAGRYMDILTEVVQRETRRTVLENHTRLGDRPWNRPGPRRGKPAPTTDDRPFLRAVVLDCATVGGTDVTAIQALVDTRNQLDRHADPDPVEWHCANVSKRWVRRALASAGFGYPTAAAATASATGEGGSGWRPIFSVARTTVDGGGGDAGRTKHDALRVSGKDVEADGESSGSGSGPRADGAAADAPAAAAHGGGRVATLHGANRPYFHVDVAAAVEAAIANIEGRAYSGGKAG